MRKIKLLSIIIASALITACAAAPADVSAPGVVNGAQAAGASGENELRVVMNTLPITLDPVASNDVPSARARRMVFDTLIFQNYRDMSLEPGLATNWDMPDPQTVTLELRQGVYFHNGDPFTAEAVKFSLERAQASPLTLSLVEFIEEIEIIDDYNVAIHLSAPFVPMLVILTQNQLGIVNPRAVLYGEAAGLEFTHADVAVGTGPLVFESFMSGAYMSLARNQDYWGQVTDFEILRFIGIPEPSNRLIEIETGNADIALDVAPIDVPHAEASPNVVLHRGPGTSVHYVGFNTLQGPLADIRVRHAIQHAINMEAIIDNAFAGTGYLSHSLASQLTWGYVSAEPFEFDLERASELLAEAGFPGGEGLDLRIWYNAGNQQRADMAEMIQNQLRVIGIDLVVETLEWASYLERTANAEHDMFILGWSGGVDPDQAFFTTLHSMNSGAPGNRTFFNNERADELLMLGRSEADYDARLEIYREFQQIVRDESPMIFAVNPEEIHATRPGVLGFYPTPNMANRFDRVYFD